MENKGLIIEHRIPLSLLLLATIVFLVNQLPFLEDMRPVMYDEAWYGDTAYNIVSGNGFSNTIVGKGGNANFLLPLLTSGFMLVFGYNLLAIRLAAVFCGAMTIAFVVLSMKRLQIGWKPQALTLLLFVSLTIYNTVFRFGRPECIALMFMAGGMWFYFRYRDDANWKNMMGLSLFAFLAGCSHPFALFMFALIGSGMLLRAITEKKTRIVMHLLALLSMAVFCIFLIIMISKQYSDGGGSAGVFSRFSVKQARAASVIYFKEAFFSKSALYMIPLLAVLVYEACFDKRNRELAIIALIHFLLFPFLFSTDLMMVGLGQDYVSFAATVLVAPFMTKLMEYKRKWVIVAYVAYCLSCLGISYYYNYGVKYEKANSVLAEELPKVIPENSRVFGPIRQWPMLMETNYQSEHTVLPIGSVESYDYVILNSQDIVYYSSYDAFLPIDESKLELVYEKPTRQYGMVQVFKTKH